MRTTIDIDKKLLQEAMKLTNVKTQRRAVSLALQELVRIKRLERLASRVGTYRTLSEELGARIISRLTRRGLKRAGCLLNCGNTE